MASKILAGVIAAIAATVLTRVFRRSPDTAAEIGASATTFDPVVAAFVDAVNRAESETDRAYVDAVAGLRADPERSARLIAEAYEDAGADQLSVRQSLLLAAAALADRAVLPFLAHVAEEAGRAPTQHSGGRAESEAALRLIAVDGIEAIANAGDTEAADQLVALVASPDRAVRAAAAVALKYGPHAERYDRVRGMAPAADAYLFDIRRADVHEVPQIADPRRHLLGAPTTEDGRPDPASGARRATTNPRRRAPRVRHTG